MQTKGIILENLGEIKRAAFKKPFLCCSPSFMKTEAFKFLNENFNLTVWNKIRPNPRFEDMVSATELFKKNECDFLIGAGGGSPLDSAKMVKLLVTNDPATALTEPMQDNDIQFLAIPTTSGTGSEATKFSVFYVNDTEKYSIANTAFLPNYVYLDERFIKTVPPYQRRATAFDALSHAVESYWNVNATDESKAFARQAIELFVKNKEAYIANTDTGNRGMLMASYYAGKAINLTSTTSAHAMCYNITINCHTAHGHSVAVCLKEIWGYMNENNTAVNDPRGRDYVLKTLDEIGIMLGGENSRDGAKIIEDLTEEFNLEAPTVSDEMIKAFTEKVNVKRLSNNPVTFTSDDVFKIYKRVLSK